MTDFTSKEFRQKQRKTDFVDRDLEIALVSGMIKDTTSADYIVSNFNPEHISSDLVKDIYEICADMYNTEGIILDTPAFKNTLNFRESTNRKLLVLWKKIRKVRKKTSLPTIITSCVKLQDLYNARILSIGLKDLAVNLKQAHQNNDLTKISKAQESLGDYTTYIQSTSVGSKSKTETGDMIDEYDAWKKDFVYRQKHPEEMKGIETGIKEIDEQMPALRKGEFGCIAGPSSGGKSILAMSFGIHNWKCYGDTCTITIEMSKEKYLMRQYCHLSGIDYGKFTRYDLNNKEWNHLDKTIEKYKRITNKNIIIDMPEGTSVLACKKEFQLGMKGNNVTLGIIDYMNIMCGPNGKVAFDWETQLSIAAETKLLIARGLNIPLWTPIQTDGKDGEAFSKHIKDQLDVGVTLKPNVETNKTGVMPIGWFKTRDFQGMDFSVETNRGKMRFTPINPHEEKVLEKINKRKKRNINV